MTAERQPTSAPEPLPPSESCITCGDVASELVVIELGGDDAICQAADGRVERVAVDLVQPVSIGDRVLVHAAVALSKVS